MTSRKPAHLLLVDDDPGLLKLLGMRLVSEGYSVVTAESGLEGLKILAREKIDLVISDLRMDEMDGLQLFAEIQKQQPGRPIPGGGRRYAFPGRDWRHACAAAGQITARAAGAKSAPVGQQPRYRH